MYRSSRGEEEFQSLSESLVRESTPTALGLIEHLYKRNRDSKFSEPSTGRQRRLEQRMLESLLSRVQDRSDESVEFCQLLATSDSFISNVFCDMLNCWSPEYLAGKLGDQCTDLMFQMITIVYNCLFKNDSFVNSNLANFDLVGPAQPLLKSPESAHSLQALLLVAFALDESKADLFLGESDIIGHLVGGLKASLSSSERSFETGNMVYSLPELARCTQRLALNDVNKGLLMKLGVLPAVKAMLEAAESQDVGAGLELAFTLSFEKDRQLKLAMGAEICDSLKRLAAAKDWEMSQTLQGLLFNMGEKFTMKVLGPSSRMFASVEESTNEGEKPVTEGNYVVISFDPEQLEFAKKLRSDLAAIGISIWDNINRSNISLQVMLEATLHCGAFIVCLSRRYKENNSCRMEAEHARNLKKLSVLVQAEPNCKPTGWLTLLLASGPMVPLGGDVAAEIRRRMRATDET